MKRVILESPFKGGINLITDKWGVDAAIDLFETKKIMNDLKIYSQRCVLDCLKRKESPMVSHLLFTQVLDDNIPDLRILGIQAGFAWHEVADYCVVYTDYGISDGMREGIKNADNTGLKIHYRKLYV